ncbi:MAG: hypothetical protein EMLJLAPB_00670 [Candidatus Argoarchaeum ethanivorans]|uniref:Uncharacterized protein n=1 Tax=Candidatus Argoarchaeum ethanivorans TaxID=2608793 RepID=A0A811THK6_9EURY|nr:MAG: hypothetical protein EMLJLAPB_00670 [Candidatus Argoarchaeum ethanivorans]
MTLHGYGGSLKAYTKKCAKDPGYHHDIRRYILLILTWRGHHVSEVNGKAICQKDYCFENNTVQVLQGAEIISAWLLKHLQRR